MGNSTLHIRLTVKADSGDPYERLEATQELLSNIQRLAVDHAGLVVNPDPEQPKQRTSIGTILVDIVPSVVGGLVGVVSAYITRERAVSVKISVETADGRKVTFDGPAEMTTSKMQELINTVQHGVGIPPTGDAEQPPARGEP